MLNLKNQLGRFVSDESGNAAMLYAGALLPMLAMIGGAVDTANYFSAKAKLQNACDAAVLAGRQAMQGSYWDNSVEVEADKFFAFNFPDGTQQSTDVAFNIVQNKADRAELLGEATATIPTILMKLFGYDTLGIGVKCDAKRDLGHNDVVLVLDVTGSMANKPSNGSGTKIQRLREGTKGLYRALDDSASNSITRFGIVPYSHTVNVGASLQNKDILRDQPMVGVSTTCKKGKCTTSVYTKWVHINQSSWNSGNTNGNGGGGGSENGNTQGFRTSGNACIEERPSIGKGLDPFEIDDIVTLADVDTVAQNAGNEPELQWGRYDPARHDYTAIRTRNGVQFYVIADQEVQVGCPSEASKLKEYFSEDEFNAAISSATARVTGGTYHDVGMLWGTRFISRKGLFASDNPEKWDDIAINKHIVFMTDGMLDTGSTLYSAHGIESFQDRTKGWGGQDAQHISRFKSACNVAKSMGVTIWVIALDVNDTEDVEDCATSAGHFYTSDGSDLEEVFEKIGQGIGNLRLTQ